jgi:hypothetical protein
MLTEYFSAITMCVPSLLMTYYHYTQPVNVCNKSIWIGSLLHAPFSIMYHLLCARNYFLDPIENLPRKLDQAMIHVAAICFTVGISDYAWYNRSTVLFNELSISYIFSAYSTKQTRRRNILIAILFYLSPILYEGHYQTYLSIFTYLLGFLYCFVYNDHFYGWGHGLSHLLLGNFLHYITIYCSQKEN